MANINKISLPNGDVFDIEDTTARAGNKSYSASISYNIITLSGSDGSESTVVLPVYNGSVTSDSVVVTTPLAAETAADMEDTSCIYLYTGNEEGYVYGNWYYYDETNEEWVSGGSYHVSHVAGITDETINSICV